MCVVSSSSLRLRTSAGIALGPILFIIAVIAILAAVIAATTNGFTGSINGDSAKIEAQAIVDYTDQIKNSIDQKLANGFDPLTFSFTHTVRNGISIITSYENNNANCASNSCEFYMPYGNSLIQTTFYQFSNKTWGAGDIYFEVDSVDGVGSSKPELMLKIMYLQPSVCIAIDNLLGLSPSKIAALTWWGSSTNWGADGAGATLGSTSVSGTIFTTATGGWTGANGITRFCDSTNNYMAVLIPN